MKPLLYLSHPTCLLHDTTEGHPERPDRLRAIETYLKSTGILQDVDEQLAIPIDLGLVANVHRRTYIDQLTSSDPKVGLVSLDPDTHMNPHSLTAAKLAAGAVVQSVNSLLDGHHQRAFCAVRPPGHHAEQNTAMGFCLLNSIAIGADIALRHSSINRIAIVDFDVHHGNGTIDIFKDRPEVLVCSSFQHPFYPHRYADIQRDHIVNTPLSLGTRSAEFRHAIETQWLPALEQHQPDMIFVSAGFDAHKQDPLAGVELDNADFQWITQLIVSCASQYAQGRIISALEGGYDLNALSQSVATHVAELMKP